MSGSLLITRPEADALTWVEALRAQGVAAEALPLITIAPPSDPSAVRSAWLALPGFKAAMFVSGNAVRHFFKEKPGQVGVLSDECASETRAWSTGPGTSGALRACGVPDALLDEPPPDAPQFDSEALWALVGAGVRPGDRVLLVRGGDAQGQVRGRDWMAGQLAAAGAEVRQVASYSRAAPVLTDAQRARAQAAAQDGSWWLFSSSEAIANLRAAVPQAQWGAARALVTHPRIAEAAQAAGFGTVRPTHPTLGAVVASIESMA